MRTLLLILFVVLASPPAAHAYKWENFRRSTNVEDRRVFTPKLSENKEDLDLSRQQFTESARQVVLLGKQLSQKAGSSSSDAKCPQANSLKMKISSIGRLLERKTDPGPYLPSAKSVLGGNLSTSDISCGAFSTQDQTIGAGIYEIESSKKRLQYAYDKPVKESKRVLKELKALSGPECMDLKNEADEKLNIFVAAYSDLQFYLDAAWSELSDTRMRLSDYLENCRNLQNSRGTKPMPPAPPSDSSHSENEIVDETPIPSARPQSNEEFLKEISDMYKKKTELMP